MNAIRIFAAALLGLGLLTSPVPESAWAAERPKTSGNVFSPAEESALSYAHELSVPPEKTFMEAPDGASATDAAHALARDFMAGRDLKKGYDPQTAIFTATGACSIPLDKDDPDFFLERAMAFQSAFEDSLIPLAEHIEREKRAAVAAELAYPGSDRTARDHAVAPPSLARLAEHAATLDENNVALAQTGIARKEWNSLSPDRKRAKSRDALARHIARLTLLDFRGAIPIQTFWGTDAKGNQSVAVISIYSPELSSAIRKLAEGNASNGTTGNITDIPLPMNEPELMLNLTGMRLFRAGNRSVLTAFGQWMQPYAGKNASIAEKYRTLALEQADAAAEDMLKRFLSLIAPLPDADLEKILAAGMPGKDDDGIKTEPLAEARLKLAHELAADMSVPGKTMLHWTDGKKDGRDIAGSVALVSDFRARSAASDSGASELPAIMVNLFAAESDFDLNGVLVNGTTVSERISRTLTERLTHSGKFTVLRQEASAVNADVPIAAATNPLPIESVSTDGDAPRDTSLDGVAEDGFTLSPPEKPVPSQIPPPESRRTAASESGTGEPVPNHAYILQGTVASFSSGGKPRISTLTGGALKSERTKLVLNCEVQSADSGLAVWNFVMDRSVDMDSDGESSTLFQVLDSIGTELALSMVEALNPTRISGLDGETILLDAGGGLYAKGDTLSVYERRDDPADERGLSPAIFGNPVGTIEITGMNNGVTFASYAGKTALKPGMVCRRPGKGTANGQSGDADDGGVTILESGGVKLPFD